jgi:hypothetical protein
MLKGVDSMPSTSVEAKTVRDMEVDVAAALKETVFELEHAEGLDDEQRAEVYTILHAMVSDCRRHEEVLSEFLAQANKDAIHV